MITEAESIIFDEVRSDLLSATALLESYTNIDRHDHNYLLLVVDHIRRTLLGMDLKLADADAMISSHRNYEAEKTTPAPEPDLTADETEKIKQAMEGLRASLPIVEAIQSQNEAEIDE